MHVDVVYLPEKISLLKDWAISFMMEAFISRIMIQVCYTETTHAHGRWNIRILYGVLF